MFKVNINLFISIFDTEKKQLSVVSSTDTRYMPVVLEMNPSDTNIIDFLIKQTVEDYCSVSISSIGAITLIDVKKHDDRIDLYYACSCIPGTKLKKGSLISMNLACVHPFARKAILYV